MGRVGKFLDRLCDERPDLAQALLDREMGGLGQMFDDVSPGQSPTCGCVVGTVALAAGFEPLGDANCNVHGTWAWDWLGIELGWDPDWIDGVSLDVLHVATRIASGPRWRRYVQFCAGELGIDDLPPAPTREAEAVAIGMVRRRVATRLATRTVAA